MLVNPIVEDWKSFKGRAALPWTGSKVYEDEEMEERDGCYSSLVLAHEILCARCSREFAPASGALFDVEIAEADKIFAPNAKFVEGLSSGALWCSRCGRDRRWP